LKRKRPGLNPIDARVKPLKGGWEEKTTESVLWKATA